ncbi:MAG: hypothetical protein N3F09_06860 [Bacteroidia bacterium]|nr:hypothetical protein [Bacteroidia bacterium]
MKERSILLFMERMWLFASAFSACVCAYFIIKKDFDSALYFLALFLISGLFYVLRRAQRKKKT